MFGYVLPEKPHLYFKDFDLYRGLYCGLCKSIGSHFGQIPRLTINYDVTFLSLLLHSFEGIDVKIEQEHCILHPIRKRPVASDDPLTEKLAAVNLLLSWHKLRDDVLDEKKLVAKMGCSALKRAYRAAKKALPRADEIIAEQYEKLRSLEKAGEESPERAADTFAEMMRRLCKELASKEDENLFDLAYLVGKWVYLIDALDDLQEDFAKNNYNPFLKAYPNFENKAAFLKENKEELGFLFTGTLTAMRESFSKIPFGFNTDLLENILFRGLPQMTKIINEDHLCKKHRTKF